MPTFPGGEQFGNAVPSVQTSIADTRGVGREWVSIQEAADVVKNIAFQEINTKRRLSFQNGILEHEIFSQNAANRVREKVARGEIGFEKTVEEYRKEVSKYNATDLGLPHAQMELLNLRKKQQIEGQAQSLAVYAKRMGVEAAKSEFLKGLDNLSKVSAYPDYDGQLESLHAVAEEDLGNQAIAGGLPKSYVESEIRRFKENSWTQHAKSRLVQNPRNVEALKSLQSDLMEDGFYDGKLSPDRINGLLAGVTNQLTRTEYKDQQLQKKVDAASRKVLDDIEKQISTGIPATAEMWSSWADVVEGSQYEHEFDRLAAVETNVQWLLTKPIQEQKEYLRERETLLKSGGGDLKDIQNYNRMKSAVINNIKQLQNDPLMFGQARSGDQVPPLQLEGILDPSLRPLIASQIDDRITTIRALQEQYGPQVKMRPLLPQEVSALSSALESSPPKVQGDLLSALRKSMNDDQAYMATMQQIAPDAPVKALAGMLMAKERNLALEKNWFSDDLSVTSGNVAQTLLVGESILNKTKEQKQSDGSNKGFPIPPQIDFDASFSSAVGDAFAGRPDAYNFAMQGVRAYYVGKSAQEGDLSGIVDSSRMKHSVRAVLGNVVDLNGNGYVFAPWGMDPSEFEDKSSEAFQFEMRSRGMNDLANRFDLFGLKNLSENRYFVLQGRNYLLDNNGEPVVIELAGGE